MNLTLIPAVSLLVIAILGVVSLRRFSDRVRITFDGVCLIAITLYLIKQHTFPVFSPLQGSATGAQLWIRAIGGAWWLLASRIVVASFWLIKPRHQRSREARLFSDLFAAAIYIATGAVVLNSVFAIPITGVVATSSLMAIVIGLALQSTLADVFAGIAVGIEGAFRVGDRIEVADRIEGRIVQINWRSIRLQTDDEDIAIVPHSFLAKSQLINRSFPTERRAVSVEIACKRHAIPERVIEILFNATLLCPGVMQVPSPHVVLTHLDRKQNVYKISFHIQNDSLSSTKDSLLRAARRQLHYAGYLDRDLMLAAGETTAGRRLLRDLVLFEHLTDEQIDKLGGFLKMRRLEPDEVLFSQGASDSSMFVIASGILEIRRAASAISEVLGCMGAGEYVGEIGMLTGEPHLASAVARTHCKVYELPRAAIAPLISQNVDVASAFDRSVRHAMVILNRDVAVRASPQIGEKGQLLLRIRRVFHFG